jgi:PAS domain S-box-containing protein
MDNPSKDRIAAAEPATTKETIEHILSGIGDDFVMYDYELRYVYVNDRAAQTLGYSKEQLTGQCIWDLFPEAVGNLFYQKMQQAMADYGWAEDRERSKEAGSDYHLVKPVDSNALQALIVSLGHTGRESAKGT